MAANNAAPHLVQQLFVPLLKHLVRGLGLGLRWRGRHLQWAINGIGMRLNAKAATGGGSNM